MRTIYLVAAITCSAILSGPAAKAWALYQAPAAAPSATGGAAPSSAVKAPAVPPQSAAAGTSQAAPSQAAPQNGGTTDGSCCGCPAPRMVERLILVPQMSWEKRLMPCVEYATEPRQETFTIMHAVPETKTITRQCTVMVPETRTRTENYTVCKPVPCDSSNGCGGCGCGGCKMEQETKQREVQYTVCVPHTKQYTCDVTVYRNVPEHRTVTVDACVSHIVQKPVDVCVCHMVSKKILVPAPTCCGPCCGGYGGCGGYGCGW
jgi:hypothetical protein